MIADQLSIITDFKIKVKEKIFGRRYQAIVVSSKEAAQIERLRYVLANGTKEGLVERPRDWPGVHPVRALLGEETLEGIWIDRTQQYSAHRRRQEHGAERFTTSETLTLGTYRGEGNSGFRGFRDLKAAAPVLNLLIRVTRVTLTERAQQLGEQPCLQGSGGGSVSHCEQQIRA
jgi:hypothetical protein